MTLPVNYTNPEYDGLITNVDLLIKNISEKVGIFKSDIFRTHECIFENMACSFNKCSFLHLFVTAS